MVRRVSSCRDLKFFYKCNDAPADCNCTFFFLFNGIIRLFLNISILSADLRTDVLKERVRIPNAFGDIHNDRLDRISGIKDRRHSG